MIKEFLLENILPNPFQTREVIDEEHVRALAQSISEQGLLQIPSARYGDAFYHPGSVQLVFGHNRLAAFKYLRDSGVNRFSTMPLNIVEMSDVEMFRAAVAENCARKDLTPIEEARAMLVYRDQFKKTSEEIGALFNLSDSAVRNKLRLLDLPAEIQEKVGKTLTEGAAREVLAFLSLPEEAKQELTWHHGNHRTYAAMVKEMIEEGVETSELSDVVDSAVRNAGQSMDRKSWKNTDKLVGDGIIGLCKGCTFITTRDGTDYCLKNTCFDAKEKAYQMSYLSQASLLTGIAVLEDDKTGYGGHSDFGYGHEDVMQRARENGCENLRLVFDYVGDNYKPPCQLYDDGFKHARVVCGKRAGQCTCMRADEAGVQVEGGSEEDLKAARREMLQAQRNELELIKHMKGEAEIKLIDGLGAMRLETWREVLQKLTYHSGLKEADSMSQLLFRLAELVIEKCTWGKRENILEQLNQLLVNCGLEEMDISFGEKEERQDDAEDGECIGGFMEQGVSTETGKTLMEVFTGDEDHGG